MRQREADRERKPQKRAVTCDAYTESLSNREWLPGELLSGSECRSPGCFLDMKYQTCSLLNFRRQNVFLDHTLVILVVVEGRFGHWAEAKLPEECMEFASYS